MGAEEVAPALARAPESRPEEAEGTRAWGRGSGMQPPSLLLLLLLLLCGSVVRTRGEAQGGRGGKVPSSLGGRLVGWGQGP